MKRFGRLIFSVIAVAFLAEGVRCAYRIASPQLSSPPLEGAGYVIVLGGGTKRGGGLGESAALRVETAAEYMKQNAKSKAVVSGGRGRYGERTESALLKEALMASGIDGGRVLEESRSRNTIENLRFSCEAIANDGGALSPIVIVTSRYHISRALFIAKKLGMRRVAGIAAPTPRHLVLRSYIREAAAWVKLDITSVPSS